MPEEIIQKEVSRVPEKDSMELILGRAVSNMGDLVHTVEGGIRDYLEGLKENFEGALGWLETQKAKATRVALAGTLVGQLATACSPRTVDAKDILSLTPAETQEYIPEPAETEVLPTLTVTPEPSLTPTTKPTEAPTPERPEELKEVSSSKDTSWIDEYSKNYSDELWAAITLGEFKEQEKAWGEMIQNFYGNAENAPFFSQEPGSEKSSLVYVYLEDQNNPGSVIVALASPDYPNKFIFPPFDFSKSKGLDVKFLETLPNVEVGHLIPDELMPTFLTVQADETSVQAEGEEGIGGVQRRFIGTELKNIGGELVRIDSEGKVIAKIGVKQESLEARWVRPMMEYSGPDWEKYPLVSLEDDIYNGAILYDYEVQTSFTPGERKFPTSWHKRSSEYGCTYWTDPIREAFDYLNDKYTITTRLGNGKLSIIEVQQVNMGDKQHFLHYTKGFVGRQYLEAGFDKSQASMPGSCSASGSTLPFGISPSDLKKDKDFYARGGELEKMMDEWLIVNKGQVSKGDIDRVIIVAQGLTAKY